MTLSIAALARLFQVQLGMPESSATASKCISSKPEDFSSSCIHHAPPLESSCIVPIESSCTSKSMTSLGFGRILFRPLRLLSTEMPNWE